MSDKTPKQPRRGDLGLGKTAKGGTDGSFASHIRTGASLEYSPLDEANAQRNAIIERLERTGSIPATTVESSTDPRFTRGIKRWWNQHLERMEQPGGQSEQFRVMPDDYTPSGTGGRAISGKRRTHRIRYSGAGVELRMPSATAIRRFSAEHGRNSFDIPIELEHEGGRISGYVRVTEGTGGVWDVKALGFPGQAAGRAAESVACVLEARRPTVALREAEAQYELHRRAVMEGGYPTPTSLGMSPLHQRRINRIARGGAEMRAPQVRSSLVTGAAYDEGSKTMVIKLGDRAYGYRVPKAVYTEILTSDAPGRAYNELVKNRAHRVEVQQCPKCGHWTRSSVKHACPAITRTNIQERDEFRQSVATMLLKSLRKAA